MGALVLYAALFAVSLPFLLWLLRENKGPIQFRLRTLFVTTTVVALILGGIGWWRRANQAQLQWLDPASPEAVELAPKSEITQADDGEWLIDCNPETTGRFSLSYDEPERVVIVRLP